MIAPLLLGAALAAALPPGEDAPDRFPRAAVSYLVAIDGRIVWAKAPDLARAPASLTKLMTALELLAGDWRSEAAVTIGPRAAAESGSSAGLRAGEVVPAGELLEAMLVASSNDACLALAEHAAGDAAAFVARMNARAAAMGLAGTRFADPCGHDAPGQRSTARDLLALAEAALARPEIERAAALRSTTLTTRGGRRITLASGNHLLGSSPGVAGLKTGYTPGAGKCLIVFARRDQTRVIIVLLGAADRWWTAAAMVEEAFDAAATLR